MTKIISPKTKTEFLNLYSDDPNLTIIGGPITHINNDKCKQCLRIDSSRIDWIEEAVQKHAPSYLFIAGIDLSKKSLARVLSSSEFSELTLMGCSIDDASVTEITKFGKKIQNLSISYNKIGILGLNQITKSLKELRSLKFEAHTPISGVDIDWSQLTRLEKLATDLIKFNPTLIRNLAKHQPRLNNLSLVRADLRDDSAKALADEFTSIQRLDLSQNELGDPGAKSLATHLHNLEVLILSDNEIGASGASAI